MTTLPVSNVEQQRFYNVSNQSSNSSVSSSAPPPPIPPHRIMIHSPTTSTPSTPSLVAPYYPIGEKPEDSDYLPDSSVAVAIQAGQNRMQRLTGPTDPEFPIITVENINKLRQEATKSQDQFFFARYLLNAVKHLNPQDPTRSIQLKQNLTNEALKIIKKLASYKNGFVDAKFFLANCYGGGLYDLKADLDKAFSLYLQGSKQSHPESTYRVAVCYELGLGTKRNYRYAMQFYRKAANLSDPSAMYKLGLILLNGLLSQSKNPREAIAWFLKATQFASEQHPQSLHELGLAYELPDNSIPSVIHDLKYARELFTQAAQFGYAPSQVKLGLAYENGYLNCPIDPKRSIAWYSRAAEQNDPNAELALSAWYLTGAPGVLNQTDQEAYLWARKAADKDLAKAEYAVGYYTEIGVGVIPNLEEATQWYRVASKHGDLKATSRLQTLSQALGTRPTRDNNGKPKDTDCTIM